MESEDGLVHLRHPQQHSHRRPRAVGADAAPGAAGGERHRRQWRPHPVRRHQAAGAGSGRRGRQEMRAVLRQLALARRHADQLEDDLRLDFAAAQARRDARVERGRRLHQEGAPRSAARARQARPRARRHQGHGRLARPRVRHRHEQGGHRDQGGAPPQRSGGGDRRHQLRSRRHHLCRSRQRRRQPRDFALLRSHRQGGDRRYRARPGRAGRRHRARRQRRSPRRCRRRPTGPATKSCPGPRGVADDLKKLAHVSPAIEKKLNDLGIFHYWQIAGLGPDAAHKIGEEVGLPGRVDSWIAKSKELTAEAE